MQALVQVLQQLASLSAACLGVTRTLQGLAHRRTRTTLRSPSMPTLTEMLRWATQARLSPAAHLELHLAILLHMTSYCQGHCRQASELECSRPAQMHKFHAAL